MKARSHLCLVAVATFAFLLCLTPYAFGQSESPQQLQVALQQPTQPSPSPSTEPSPSRQTPSDPNRTAEPGTNSPRSTSEYADDRNSFSWGSFIGGILLGGIIGYLVGRRPVTPAAVRRDRAA